MALGKRNQQYKKEEGKKLGAPVSVPHRIPMKHMERIHMRLSPVGCGIVNTVTCCYSQGLAIGLNGVILTHLCAMFQLSKSKCYESFETKFSRKGFGGLDFRVFLLNQFPCLDQL